MDEQLKQRLVGASVLVIAAVIFVPMLLEPPAGEDAPAPGTADRPAFSSRVVPVDEPGPPAAAARPEVTPLPVAAPGPPPLTDSRPEPVPAPPPPPPPPAAVAPVPAPVSVPVVRAPATSPVGGEAWNVQLGSFSNSRNANGLAERLRAQGYPAFVRSGDSAQGPVTRVYVGPSPSREAAGTIVERLQRETKLRGIVVRADD